MNASEFDQAVYDFLDDKISEDELCKAFYWLVGDVADYFKIDGIFRDDYLQDGVMICFDKLPRYNKEKGIAFNFFWTIISCLFRQDTRKKKNYQELKDKYKKFLNGD